MTASLTFTIGSEPDREDLVADLVCDDVVWAQIHNENGELEIEIYPRPDGTLWCLPLNQTMEMIDAARQRLTQLQRAPG